MSVRDLIILGISSQQPTRSRNHGAYLLRWNEEGFLFDPGEGTQRQFIFANISPPTVTRIFISHFHGDHCLGLGSMLLRLNLDKVTHPIHCYYPASGKKYFDRLRYCSIYHEVIDVVEHPVEHEGIVHDDGKFLIEAYRLDHSIDNFGWRITEADKRKFDKEKLKKKKIQGPLVKELQRKGSIEIENELVNLDDVSWIKKGDIFAVVIDTKMCDNAIKIAKDAKLLLCEATYSEEHKDLAFSHYHLTSRQAALIAQKANAKKLVLTHFSARYRKLDVLLDEACSLFRNTELAEELKSIPFLRD